MKKFEELGMANEMLKAIQDMKFEKPTQIQANAIPPVVEGKDVIAGSATGSGKTLVFSSSIIKEVVPGQGVQAICLTPTRELTDQVAKMMNDFCKYKPMEIATIVGGLSINPQIEQLKSADIVVGTPGRVLDHMERGTMDLTKIKILVLDEADRMLDMGFIEDVERIIMACKSRQQTLLFSATISAEIDSLVDKYMNDPVTVSVETNVDPKKLKQIFYDVPDKQKFSLLVHLLKQEQSMLTMVFTNSRNNADFVAKNLKSNGINALELHGGFSQERRNKTMQLFHKKEKCVLVCTDVAARGLDIPAVSHVYNYDIPNDPKEYIHRIGRTARAGKEGKAVNILSQRDYENYDRLIRDMGVEAKKMELPKMERVKITWKVLPKGHKGRSGGNFSRGHASGGRSFPRNNRESSRSHERPEANRGERRF